MLQLGLENEIVESPTDKGIGADIGISHIILTSDLLLAPLHNLSLSYVYMKVLCCCSY